jgi:hypothetical protein
MKSFLSTRVALLLGMVSLGMAGTVAAAVPRAKALPKTVTEKRDSRIRHEDHRPAPEIDGRARTVEFDPSRFRSDPVYPEDHYDAEEQLEIYGGKTAFDEPRPILEVGYPMYDEGPLGQTHAFFGEKNLARPQLLVYGDLRTAVSYADKGEAEEGLFASRFNLDVDLKLTATERIHAIFRPLENDGQISSYSFAGKRKKDGALFGNGEVEALFFEGDLAAIQGGITGEYAQYDLPIAAGLMPMFIQNGVWLEDAFEGVAITIPARNSKKLDITNYDVTFFASWDDITSNAFVDEEGFRDEDAARLVGVATFMDVREGYLEAGYAYVDDTRDRQGNLGYHNVTVAFTKRYGSWLSNSVRLIGNFGQDAAPGEEKTADGYAILIENSLITHLPTTLVPYLNLFLGVDKPVPLARNAGLLKNTGIAFEDDGMTKFPTMDDSANDTYGGALGIQYLFNLDQQLVFEISTVQTIGKQAGRKARGAQYGAAIRFQRPITDRWIVRADAVAGIRENEEDFSGLRFELRRKF